MHDPRGEDLVEGLEPQRAQELRGPLDLVAQRRGRQRQAHALKHLALTMKRQAELVLVAQELGDDRAAELTARVRIDRPILDLAGAPAAAVEAVLDAFPAGVIR